MKIILMFGLQIGGNREIPVSTECSYESGLLFQMFFQLFIGNECLPFLFLSVSEWLEVEELLKDAKVVELEMWEYL